jgi:hypothetical protein
MNIVRRIKNWLEFQHYHTGKNAKVRPEWIKLYHRLLDDMEWHDLEPVAAKTLVNLWLLASENGGALPPLKEIAFRLRMPEKQINAVLSKLPHWIENEAAADPRTLSDPLPRPDKEEEGDIEKEEDKNENALSREFEDHFWPAYPHKTGRPTALQKFLIARRTHSLETILSGLSRYCSAKPPDRQWLNPATFLNQERFLDEPAEVAVGPPQKTAYLHGVFQRHMEKINGTGGTGRGISSGNAGNGKLLTSAARTGGISGADGGIVSGSTDANSSSIDEPG